MCYAMRCTAGLNTQVFLQFMPHSDRSGALKIFFYLIIILGLSLTELSIELK